MKRFSKKAILITVLVYLLIGAFIAYKIANKSHLDISSTSPQISIEATKLIDEFVIDETTANTKYLDKLIAVNGTISSIKIKDEKGIISLKTDDDFGSILCHLSNETTKNISQLENGQSIQIKGICTGFLMDVILVRCEIIKP